MRVLSTPHTSISVKPRSVTTLSASALWKNHPRYLSPFQRRFASEEVTQAEPEADGATEAQHDENSIASSTTPDQSSTTNSEEPILAADQEDHSTISSALSSATETVSNTASSATTAAETIRGYAADAAAAAGIGAATAQVPAGRSGGEGAPQSTTIYVGNLFFDVTEEILKKEFQRFGDVDTVRIIRDGRGLSKGYVIHCALRR